MTTQDDALAAVQEADRLYLAWRAAVDESIATGNRAACREALRLFERYQIAKERAAMLAGTFGHAHPPAHKPPKVMEIVR